MFCIYSPHLCPRFSDYSDKVYLTGFWVLKPNPDHKLDDAIIRYLDAGSPPVYMGFGSMPLWDVKGLVSTFSDVLKKLNLRGIFCGGWNELKDLESLSSDHLLLIKGAPHELLLPKCLMAIHHGGAGTTAAVARSGIPNVIFPALGDQPFWAHRIAILGAGPLNTFSIKEITASTLETQISYCLQESVKQKAVELGSMLKDEDGLAHCINIFEEDFKKRIPKMRLEWQSPDAPNCTSCSITFSFTIRAHHCRSCGLTFCSKCAMKIPIMNWIEPQYVCLTCQSQRLSSRLG